MINMDDFQEDFVEALNEHGMVRVAGNPDDTWTLTSKRPHPDTGEPVEVKSPYYFNMTGFGNHADVLEPMMVWLEDEVDADNLAGVNTGGNSMASALSAYAIANGYEVSSIPVRKPDGDDRYTGEKRLGLADDVDIEGETVEIVDDVGTTGNKVAELHELLYGVGAEVGSWNIAVDRMEGLQENASDHDADVNALINAQEALDVLYNNGDITDNQYETARAYTEDPMGWNIEKGFIG